MYQTEALIRNFYQAFSFCLWVITNRRKKAKQLRLFIKRLYRYSPKSLLQSARKSRNLGKNLALQAEIGSLSYLKYDNHSFVPLKSRRFQHQHAGLGRQRALSGKPHSASFSASWQPRKKGLGVRKNFLR